MAENINIGGRLHSTATGNVVAAANEILDDTINKKQSEINVETYRLVENINESLENLSPEQTQALGVAIKANNNEVKLGYFECETEGNIAAKVITNATAYILSKGGSIKIKMINANTASNVTLNINSTGAKTLYYDGELVSPTNTWENNEIIEVYYDGNNYYANNISVGGKFATGEKVKNVGIDAEPTAGSENLVKSGGVAEFTDRCQAGMIKNGIWISLFASNSYMNTQGVVTPLNGYDLYEIKGINPNDIFIIANADGGSVLATGLSLNYLCQGKLQDNSYIDLRSNQKNGGAEEDVNLPYFIIAVPSNIKSIYFTKKRDENKNIVFYRLGGDIINGINSANYVVASSQFNPINIFSNYKASVYPNPYNNGKFKELIGYSFAYAKLKVGDVITIVNTDTTDMSTVGWVFTFNDNVISSSILGIISEYKATDDCYICIANKDTNTNPIVYWKPKEYNESIGRLFEQTNSNKNYKFIACVLRNVNGTWQQIDGAHKSLNVASIEQDNTYIKVNYGFTAQNVVSFVACPDEDFANIGYAMGSSVGLEYAQIKITQYYELAMYVYWNGTSWSTYGGVTDVTFNNGIVHITHPSIGGVSGSASCRGGSYIASLGSLGTDTTDVVIQNYNGEPVTSLDTNFKIYVTRISGATVIKPEDANGSGNIWCFGIMEV